MNSSVGSTQTTVRPGETAQATIELQGGPVIAKAFVIHFARDSAFIEPAMRPVLRQVADYAAAHPKEKLLIVGHTDLTGSAEYNQSLSERRARSAYAFLTYDYNREASLAEWKNLRLKRPKGKLPCINDTWGVREYQHILQDLGYYMGNIHGMHDSLTNHGMAQFQNDNNLCVDGIAGDMTWNALIEEYLSQDCLSIMPASLFSNSGDSLKWLGCGELDPVENRQDAWRPNRRTELLFVPAVSFSFDIAKPVTSDEGVWKFGAHNSENRCNFATRNKPQKGKWFIQAIQPGSMMVQGSIKFLNGAPLSNVKFEIVAPNGENLGGEHPVEGFAIPGRTDGNGSFSYAHRYPCWGVYTMEVQGPYVVNVRAGPGDSYALARGSMAWRKYEKVASHASELQGANQQSLSEPHRILEIIAYQCPSQVKLRFLKYETREHPLGQPLTAIKIKNLPNLHRIQIEGLPISWLSKTLKLKNLKDHNLTLSLFVVEAYEAEWEPDELEIYLYSSTSPCSEPVKQLSKQSITLSRDKKIQNENRFVSPPLLAIPPSLTNYVQIDKIHEYKVIGAIAGGSLHAYAQCNVDPASNPSAAGYPCCATLQGRVVYVYPQVVRQSTSRDEAQSFIDNQIKLANDTWAQAGIEVKKRKSADLFCGDAFQDLNSLSIYQPMLCHKDYITETDLGLSDKAKRIFGLHPACLGSSSPLASSICPNKSDILTDVNIYIVDELLDVYTDDNDQLATLKGASCRPWDVRIRPVIILSLLSGQLTKYLPLLAHELGHLLLMSWWEDKQRKEQQQQLPVTEDKLGDHLDLAGKPWYAPNILAPTLSHLGIEVDDTQLELINDAWSKRVDPKIKAPNYCVVLEPPS